MESDGELTYTTPNPRIHFLLTLPRAFDLHSPHDMLPNNTDSDLKVDKRDPWLDDGSIVFSCEGAARFRVHASVMKRHSEVFRNMFADADIKADSTNAKVVEGCLVVELSDMVEDCQNFMLALYGPVLFKLRNEDDFLHVSSILRLSTKYCVDWLRNKAIAFLNRSWPHTWHGWDNIPSALRRAPVPHPALIINLARTVDAPILLPNALYRLGRLPPEEVYGVELTCSAGPIPKPAYCLSREDVVNHLRYKTCEVFSARSLIAFLHDFATDGACETKLECNGAFEHIAEAVAIGFLNLRCTPLGFIGLAGSSYPENTLCHNCHPRFIAAVQTKKLELWDALPEWFHLPGWDVLTADFVQDP